MIIVIGIILLVLFILCIVRHKRGRGCTDDAWLGSIFLGVGLTALLIVVPLVRADNIARIAAMNAFREENVQNYAISISATRALLSEEEFIDKVIAGSLEKIEVGKSVSEAIREWRDAVNRYNLNVARMQRIRTISIYPGWLLVPEEINELPLLRIDP